MKFSANFNIENFRFFLDCLSCLNKLTKDISKNCTNILKITRDKINIITRTNGILDSYYEIYTNELFVEPIILKEDVITLEISINTLFDSLNSTIKSEDILLYINEVESDEYLYVKYMDSLYTTINITLKIPIRWVSSDVNDRFPEIPSTQYNVNLSKLQTITFLLSSLNKTGNNVIELIINLTGEVASQENLINKCNLKINSIGNILNIESEFSNLQVFSTYPGEEEARRNTKGGKSINIYMNTNIVNTLFKSIIESNLYNKNKSLILISVPDDKRNNQYVYIIISIIQLESCQMVFIIPNIKDLMN